MPDSESEIDEDRLERYSDLVDRLLEAGIEPIVTLGHGRTPARLADAGGWAANEAVPWFLSFAGVVGARLGDRVAEWETMRDPFVALEPQTGRQRSPELFRPGRTISEHLIAGHRGAVRVLRGHCPGSTIGMSIDLDAGNCRVPGSHDVVDVALKTGWLPMLAETTIAPIDVLGIRFSRTHAEGGLGALLHRVESAAGFSGYRITDGTVGAPLDRSELIALRDDGLNIVTYLDEQ